MKLILLGAPGSGKGTQAANITEKFDLPHISTGDLFRENINKETALGKKVKAVMSTGQLCPDDLTIEMVKDRLSQPDCSKGYLLDGFPRNLKQAQILDGFCSPNKVININLDLDKIEHRITGRRSCANCKNTYHVDNIGDRETCPNCGAKLIIRKDDNVETIKERLEVYREQTQPLVEYYSQQGKLYNVDGDKGVDEVFEEIVKALNK